MINLGHYSGNGHDLRYRRAKVDYILTGIALIPVLVEWGHHCVSGRCGRHELRCGGSR